MEAIIVGLGVNYAASLAITFTNKWILTNLPLPSVALVCYHFACTFIALYALQLLGVFAPKHVPAKKILPLSLTFCGSVVLTNLSLKYNTIGTYQVLKCLADPLFIVIQTVFYEKRFSRAIKLTMVPMIAGIVINSANDLMFSKNGTIAALAAVLVTSVYTVWVREKQEELNLTPMQILYYQAPQSCILLLPVLFLELVLSGSEISLSTFIPSDDLTKGMMLVNGLSAFTVNLLTYWIIRHTSVITYATFGKLKLCTTMLIGFIKFNDPLDTYQLFGIILTMLGVFLYTLLKLNIFNHFKMSYSKMINSNHQV
ncbi:Oidioi.mRNA.OKI2018_I69.chr2.g6325.t1.cds [Oikopleura dioica]|uniref:Oidioi.mRNA.OKI2018_I69.chr2.g6325.t1.cds n=1 Tax=Oikopleura dioica TaxID=34765 RepID=A0ABN7T9P8_OIKDI|nr:Oidioi.mRNA.OKI2018_I69.chr2.g6325.t1.cds [Oikopleura dioica]